MKIKHLFSLLIILSVFSRANCQQKSLSCAQLKEDFEIFKSSIVEALAGLYWYNDTSAIDNRLGSISITIQQKKSQTEFHKRMVVLFRLLQTFAQFFMLTSGEYLSVKKSVADITETTAPSAWISNYQMEASGTGFHL